MAMGHKDDEQETLFVTYTNLRGSAGHPFYEALEKILKAQGFDPYVEGLCESFYKQGGRPSIAALSTSSGRGSSPG
jgi:transposase